MLKTLIQLLDDDIPVFRRYLWMAFAYSALCGLSSIAVVPVLTLLLAGNLQRSLPWLFVLLGGVFLCWVVRRYVEQAGIRVGIAILQGARHRLGDKISQLPLGWFTPQHNAQLAHLVTQGMMTVAQLPAHVLTPIIVGVMTPLILILALFALHWLLGLMALIALPLLAGVLLFTTKLAQRADQAFHHRFAASSQRVVEFAQAQSVLRAFGGQGHSVHWLEQDFELQRASGKRLILLSSGAAVLNLAALQLLFAILLIAAVLGSGVHQVGTLPAAQVIATVMSLFLLTRFIDGLLDVVGYGEVLRGARHQLTAIRILLETKSLPTPQTHQLPADASVSLSKVHFRYERDDHAVLHDINLHIASGSMTALVGESGSGKTTLMRLIARFFDTEQGSVCIGGVDVRQLTDAQLASQISQIFQDNYLFTGSIADNIRLGKPDASEAELMQVVRLSGVSEMISRLPQGLETPVGEGGARLSGGERQRIAIARALIKDAPILLVDEATAALDAHNQAAITETLQRLRGQRTVIVIAHQLSTITMADQIVVLEQGRIIEQGSPSQLLENGKQYPRFLAERQAAKGWRIATEVFV